MDCHSGVSVCKENTRIPAIRIEVRAASQPLYLRSAQVVIGSVPHMSRCDVDRLKARLIDLLAPTPVVAHLTLYILHVNPLLRIATGKPDCGMTSD